MDSGGVCVFQWPRLIFLEQAAEKDCKIRSEVLVAFLELESKEIAILVMPHADPFHEDVFERQSGRQGKRQTDFHDLREVYGAMNATSRHAQVAYFAGIPRACRREVAGQTHLDPFEAPEPATDRALERKEHEKAKGFFGKLELDVLLFLQMNKFVNARIPLVVVGGIYVCK